MKPMQPAAPSLLLLIPAYNEEGRIGPVLRDYALHLRSFHRGRYEVLVVLNGCTDRTLEVVESVRQEHPEVRAVNFPEAIGKGGALIEGLRMGAEFDLIGYVDADGATSPAGFLQLVAHADQADCVIGSRWMHGSVIHQMQSGRRRFASRVFHAIVQCLFWMNIRDTQCGAKVMRRAAVEHVHSALQIADMAFDINLLYAMKRKGFKILEVPTEWTDRLGSKVVLGRTSLTMLLSIIRLRLVYSPFYNWLRPLRPLEAWIYRKLRSPAPRRTDKNSIPKK